MNELAFSDAVRKVLDDGAERVPYRVAHRLQASRARAIERVLEQRATAAVTRTSASVTVLAAAGGRGEGDDFTPRSAWVRGLIVALPVIVAAAALVLIAQWSDHRRAEETADLDLAVLTDDIPISVYADKGFGVFLRNSRQ